LPITRGKYPAMWSSLPPEVCVAMLYILRHILGSERPSYFSIDGLKSLGYLIVQRRRENEGKLLTAPGLADGARVLISAMFSQKWQSLHMIVTSGPMIDNDGPYSKYKDINCNHIKG
jgi:hypothetical protein